MFDVACGIDRFLNQKQPNGLHFKPALLLDLTSGSCLRPLPKLYVPTGDSVTASPLVGPNEQYVPFVVDDKRAHGGLGIVLNQSRILLGMHELSKSNETATFVFSELPTYWRTQVER